MVDENPSATTEAAADPPAVVEPSPTPAAPTADLGAGRWGAVFLTTATTVFLAELGDKTQLAALLLSAQSGQPVVVFIGAALALVCSSLVGVLLGRWLAGVMPAHQLERLAGILMVGLGLWIGRQAALGLMAP
ncbi:TMEM165/GDT1 family protein [Cyanobium sp. ATX 6F1]|uniref:TMEM165/GDT1 family protein n=1 Tax=unclassified Cyanobium TaxID=2627006 RepID=UPI0020CD7177|nr:TMEM165/GDT1 family protein [Cyanobium sp. ATX 6F1]MCP9914938.1 TMEM165/GDT1 family protein [Cyanobium sp. ATX 6F1]